MVEEEEDRASGLASCDGGLDLRREKKWKLREDIIWKV